jgi:hypothetical protein
MTPGYGIARAISCTLTGPLGPRGTLVHVRSPRRRRTVARPTLILLWPLFRYSPIRDAHVLRLIGGRRGPVLVARRAADHGPQSTAC